MRLLTAPDIEDENDDEDEDDRRENGGDRSNIRLLAKGLRPPTEKKLSSPDLAHLDLSDLSLVGTWTYLTCP